MCPPLIAAVPAIATFMGAHAAAIGTAATIGSTALSTVGGIRSSQAAQGQATYQSQLAEINANRADVASRDALERGTLDAVAHGRQVAALRGRQSAASNAAGLEAGYGTPADVANDTTMLAGEDARRITLNAERESDSYRINAANYRTEAVGARAARSASRSSMYVNAGSTLLGGASQIAGSWAKHNPTSAAPKRGISTVY